METQIALTRTKAGRRLMGLLVTFNSGDGDRLRAYIAEHTASEVLQRNPVEEWTDQLIRIYRISDGLKIHQVVATDEYKVVVLVRAHSDGAFSLVELAVSDEYPYKIAEFLHRPA
jgi:hypothetical protein